MDDTHNLPHFSAWLFFSCILLTHSLSLLPFACFGSWCVMAGLFLTLWHLVETQGPIYGLIKTPKSQQWTISHIWLSAACSGQISPHFKVSSLCVIYISHICCLNSLTFIFALCHCFCHCMVLVAFIIHTCQEPQPLLGSVIWKICLNPTVTGQLRSM